MQFMSDVPQRWQRCARMFPQVRLGRLHGVSFAGVTGCVPLLTLGPCSVGPGPVEKSSLVAPEGVRLYIDPLTSLVQQQLVLTLALHRPEVSIVQGEGFSWLGYPDDTQPSSRDLFPGLDKASDPPQAAERSAPNDSAPGEAAEDGVAPVALGRISMREGRVAVLVQSERVPRYVENVTGSLTLGKHYR